MVNNVSTMRNMIPSSTPAVASLRQAMDLPSDGPQAFDRVRAPLRREKSPVLRSQQNKYYVTQSEAKYYRGRHPHGVERRAFVPEQEYDTQRDPYHGDTGRHR